MGGGKHRGSGKRRSVLGDVVLYLSLAALVFMVLGFCTVVVGSFAR